jgi:hypothetical protein
MAQSHTSFDALLTTAATACRHRTSVVESSAAPLMTGAADADGVARLQYR